VNSFTQAEYRHSRVVCTFWSSGLNVLALVLVVKLVTIQLIKIFLLWNLKAHNTSLPLECLLTQINSVYEAGPVLKVQVFVTYCLHVTYPCQLTAGVRLLHGGA
jgi:hypothetical protein